MLNSTILERDIVYLPHKVDIGVAQKPSPNGIISSPSYSKIPIKNCLAAICANFLRPFKSFI